MIIISKLYCALLCFKKNELLKGKNGDHFLTQNQQQRCQRLATSATRRVVRISKRGGFFERVRQLQATLTRIFIALESDSSGLSEIETYYSAEIGNSNGFSAQKQVISKKKVFTKIKTDFSAEIGYSNGVLAQNHVISKKKRSAPKLKGIFWGKSEIQTALPAESRQLLLNFGTQIPLGGCFHFLSKTRPQNL